MKKRMIRIAVLAAAFAVLSPICRAEVLDGCSVDDETQRLTVYGTVSGANRYDDITIELLRNNVAIENDTKYSAEKILDDFVFVKQVLADENGGYSFTVNMSGEEVGFYELRVNGEAAEKKVFYVTSAVKTELADKISKAVKLPEAEGIAELMKILDSGNSESEAIGILGLDGNVISKLNSYGFCEVIYANLQNEDLLDRETIINKATIASYIEGLREDKADIMDYEDEFELDKRYISAYQKLPAEAKSSFVSYVYKDQNVLLPEAVSAAFNVGVPNRMAASLNAWGTIEFYLTEFGSETGVDMTAFNKLGSAQKSELYSDILRHSSFAGSASFAAYANTRIAALRNSQNNSNSGGSSGGGGSGGGGNAGYRMGDASINSVEPVRPDNDRPATGFVDLAGYEWARESIERLADAGVVTGVGEGKYEPERNVLREEFVVMLLRAYGIEEENEIVFSDVVPNSWCAGFIAAAVKKGLVNGISETEFGIGAEITREDAAVLAYRAAIKSGKSFAQDGVKAPFEDDAEIADYASDAVYAMKSCGIINGRENNMFCPGEACTRAETAKIIYSLLND